MTHNDPTLYSSHDGITTEAYRLNIRRISWGAVFAGVILSIVTYLLLSMLGTAIGASTIDPLKESNPLDGLGTGALIWTLVNVLLSYAVGGYFAGYLARREGALHGVLSWGVVTLISAYIIATLFGSALGGAMNVAGEGLKAVGSGIASAVPQAGSLVKNQLQQANINLDDLQNELTTTLRQTGKPELQPENLKGQAQGAADQAMQQAGSSQAPDQDIKQWLSGVISRGDSTLQAADRDALKNIIKARTGKSDQEADQIVDKAQQAYTQAYQKYQQLKADAEQKAREVADKAAAQLSKASWFAFVLLVIGGVIAGFAGVWGFRTQLHHVAHEDRARVNHNVKQ
ncbi:hypothetical protein LLQ46_04830 [Rouxiella badensis]|jgi:ElaB/YqjD/DUF883 family membrane-anchored ribosome-binding protein|uniref:hypothetical protein n=1 Tax=Rouxiella badensis TaxID=1646377 RepID=UPI001B55315E|nr:hypothetical protein [Rouxiella badensis]MCC3701474.1 hypothetical protein [Rouxiella badensis]MCC3717901.1 hypothetical protein [Rouxiella badensis]MCC3730084.1 hypothetical protein [Rouxiella badensis]MCC3739244.1 hypothetical protein [Rouxiella badensis]MCC3746165.1 hypothetical protein [Rouxiella badensis]